MNRWSRVPAAGAFALALTASALVPVPALAAHRAGDAKASGRSLGCTVKHLDVGESRLEVIVGVGHALRIVRMKLAESCGASTAGRPIPLEAIRPGDIVRLRYEPAPAARATPSGGVVILIDLVVPGSRRGRP